MDSTRKLLLTEEEAYALLALCMTSPTAVDEVAMRGMRKLAECCAQRSEQKTIESNYQTSAVAHVG